ncbi:hypothetical protein lerEdw1_012925 [Lerista edwardsae]|nr:hypothetical protein lerEdw1_012925 [Lerista edwardsae]
MGLNKALAIALGCFVLLNLVAVLVFALRYRVHHAQGEMDTSTSPADSYHIVPRNKSEGKREPSLI